MQIITICGFLGQDCEEKTDKNGKPYWVLNVGVTLPTHKDITTWWRTTFWNHEKPLEWCKKGSNVIVSGELSPPEVFEYNGAHKMRLNIRGKSLQVLMNKRQEKEPEYKKGASLFDEDIPF